MAIKQEPLKTSAVVPGVLHNACTHWRDYYQLTKPKVVALLVLTAWVGMMLAVPGLPDLGLVVAASLGIGLVAAGAAAFNHVLDQKIDAQMARTYMRPLPKGKLTQAQALGFASSLAVLGFTLLIVAVNPLTALLTLFSLLGYAVVYTLLLKRATPQNIVIGGLAGAMPPLLGWTAITGEIHSHALLLVMIIFTWTPPHFWALAIHRYKDYAKVNIPMLPVTHGIEFTKWVILLYAFLLLVVCLLPYLVGMSGIIYLLGSLYLNLRFVAYAWRLKYRPTPEVAMETFRFSIVHLMVLFLILLVDHYVQWQFLTPELW
ncbi:heme o synthase [Cellvibrio japonicus]|uniref:Protoheme IX farnesyltransferase n=1 Tax=Cellvibrio japonicus (strain Ueda107) TaxID=498211 RepID=B3PKW6_CELJU|nr:heme o synthase [Cellvibrio japonicus]ACE83266.1 protoheme IX farnesyltransferase [Cellvibrio japonicus Ueda107]QEI11523.1 protoheme IX farnesyltransferase [Cellvibrio japonicus]QEI15097.1 protoheme IX farnesyltransferase [Cellvibrio japonicus]QEI18677.1 protoheme IX farnesyltransferase [Cellvibrio japonicus]